MPTTDTTAPYEILIRFDAAGTLQGAHYQTRRIVEIDGERIMDQLLAAEPLALAAEAAGPTLAAVLGETLTASLAQLDTLTAALAEANARADEAEARAAEAEPAPGD